MNKKEGASYITTHLLFRFFEKQIISYGYRNGS